MNVATERFESRNGGFRQRFDLYYLPTIRAPTLVDIVVNIHGSFFYATVGAHRSSWKLFEFTSMEPQACYYGPRKNICHFNGSPTSVDFHRNYRDSVEVDMVPTSIDSQRNDRDSFLWKLIPLLPWQLVGDRKPLGSAALFGFSTDIAMDVRPWNSTEEVWNATTVHGRYHVRRWKPPRTFWSSAKAPWKFRGSS